MDPTNKNRAFAMTLSQKQYITEDQGNKWRTFEIDIFNGEMASIPKITFNFENPNYLMISNYECPEGQRLNRNCKHRYFSRKMGLNQNQINYLSMLMFVDLLNQLKPPKLVKVKRFFVLLIN